MAVHLAHGHSAVMAERRPQWRKTFIKQWRLHRGLTQAQLGSRVGISEPHLSLIENGHRQYTQQFLEALSEALMTDPASLLMRDPSQEDAMWSVWEDLEPAQRKQAIAVIDAIKKAAG